MFDITDHCSNNMFIPIPQYDAPYEAGDWQRHLFNADKMVDKHVEPSLDMVKIPPNLHTSEEPVQSLNTSDANHCERTVRKRMERDQNRAPVRRFYFFAKWIKKSSKICGKI